MIDDYNPIFDRFIDDAESGEDHIVGLIAYGIYKTGKREWAAGIRERESRAPTQEELRAYIQMWTKTQLESAQSRARQVIGEFAESVETQAEPRILKSALRGRFFQGFYNPW